MNPPTREQLTAWVSWAKRLALGQVSHRDLPQRQDEAIEAALIALADALRTTHDRSWGATFKAFAKLRIKHEVVEALKLDRERASSEVSLEDLEELPERWQRDPDALAVASGSDVFFMRCVMTEMDADGEAGLLRRETYRALRRELQKLEPMDARLLVLRRRRGEKRERRSVWLRRAKGSRQARSPRGCS